MSSDFTNSACCLINPSLGGFCPSDYGIEIFACRRLFTVQTADTSFIRLGAIGFGGCFRQRSQRYLFLRFNITFIQTCNEIITFNCIAGINLNLEDSRSHFRCDTGNGF